MTLQPSEIGTPQGGPLSPLLANILLDDLDTELQNRGHRFARYADDLLVLVKSERAGQRVKTSLTRWLDRKLKLPVNEQKSRVTRVSEVVFLGFTFRGTKLRWSDAAIDNFKHRIRQLTGRSWGVSMGYRRHKLGEYLRGWAGYFGISQYYRPVPGIDDWIRRRIRMCYWKQWRYMRTHGAQSVVLGHLQTSSDPPRHQQQKLLAVVEDAGDPQRDDQRRVKAAGLDQLSRPLDKGARLRLIFVGVCFLNRPVRTRMPGGVERAD